MKPTLLSLLLLLSHFYTRAQRDFNLLIGLNLNDCINCYNHDLERLDQQKNNVDIVLVLGKTYAPDSSKIIKKYNLHGITKHIVWSDSLLDAINGDGPSSVLFASKYHTLAYRFSLKGLPKYLISYIQKAGLAFDSLFLDHPKVALGANRLYVNEGKVYFINSVLDEINGYDLLSGKKIMHFEITDSLLDVTFPFSGLPVTQRKMYHDILRRAHMTAYEIGALSFDKGIVYARFTNNYFTVEEDSTLRRDNVSMLKIVKDKVNSIYRYPYCYANPFDDSKGYCNTNQNFYFYKDGLYNFIYTNMGGSPDRYVLGRFEPNKKNVYEPTEVNPMKNPKMYDYTLDCQSLEFDKDYFAFPLIDTLYPIANPHLPPVALNFLPAGYDEQSASKLCMEGLAITTFKITNTYVWVALYNGKTRQRQILRHNRHTGENQYTQVPLDRNIIDINFDPVNPDYILYTTRSSNLYRKKMF